MLYHQGSTIQLLGIMTALVAVAMFWPVADQQVLSVWLLVMVLLSLLRMVSTRQFLRRKIEDSRELERWGWSYVLGTFLSGWVWGALAFNLDPSWPAPYQVILFVIYTGITAGAFNTNSSLFIAFPAFYLPPVGCLMVVLLGQGGEGFTVLAALFMIYIVLMYVSALKFHNRLSASLEIRFENEMLARKLEQSNRQLAQLADMDELTGIPNRRSLDRTLNIEWKRLHRTGKPLSLLFADIDFFKQYNDTYGHDGGDRCLVTIAQLLQEHAQRASDLAARFGGEEFAVVLPETSAPEALRIAEEIREAVYRRGIPHASSTIAGVVTMSIGVATMVPNHSGKIEMLRKAADKALYQAKRAGRNQVVNGTPLLEKGVIQSLLP